jgi:ATP-binding cassette, subfamily B, bacterial MsbA
MADESVLSTAELWRLLRPYRRRAAIVMVLVLADTALASLGVGIVLPVLQAILDPEHRSPMISSVFPGFDVLSPDSRLLLLALSTVLVFAAKSAIALATVVSSNRLLQRLRFYWIDRIGTYYLCGPFAAIARRKQGELFNDWFNETLSATRFFQAYLAYVSSLVLVIALAALGFVVDWRAMLALVTLGSIVAGVVRWMLYAQSSTLSAKKLSSSQAVSATMIEDLANVRDIKLMRAERGRLQHLRERCDRLSQVLLRSAVVAEVPRVLSELTAVFLLMGMVIVGALVMNLRAETMLPAIVFFSVTSYRLVSAASQMMGARIRALNEMQSLRRIEVMVSLADKQETLNAGEPMGAIESDIALRHVDYAYTPDTPVLNDIDILIPRGRTTFLVGPSGSGKSTLLDLLLRLMEPGRGTIEANGRPASEFRLADWRRAFGYVSQEVSLFNGSIRMNLLLARPDASDEDIVAACRLAGADTFINLLSDGYDTNVGDRGYSLSGGQRKRIGIARALIRQPSVLILDEATSSFEQSLDYEILSSLKSALPDLTIIHVSHRPQSIGDADWVIMLEAGRVVACGAWEQVRTVEASNVMYNESAKVFDA